jgi:hypothetical protein
MGLKVTLANANFNLRRMQTVPVVIIVKKDYVRKRYNEPIDEEHTKSPEVSSEPDRSKSALSFEETPFVVDKTMSGFYTIDSLEYIYDNGKITQELTLLRREWPTPPQTY